MKTVFKLTVSFIYTVLLTFAFLYVCICAHNGSWDFAKFGELDLFMVMIVPFVVGSENLRVKINKISSRK